MAEFQLDGIFEQLENVDKKTRIDALDLIFEHISSDSILEYIYNDNTVFQKIIDNIAFENPSNKVLLHLINISASNMAVFRLIEENNFVAKTLQIYKSKPNMNTYLTLLSNITTDETLAKAATNQFVEWIDSYEPNFLLQSLEDTNNKNLTESSLLPSTGDTFDCSANYDNPDEFQYGLSILCNLSRIEEGRSHLLSKKYCYINGLLRQFSSTNIIRRRGAVGTIHNLLFDANVHLELVFEYPLLTSSLLSLLVNTPLTDSEKEGMDPILVQANTIDKKPEEDPEILRLLLEIIILLCQKRNIREELRRRKVYPIVRNLDYLLENNDTVSELVYEIVNFLMRDEEPNSSLLSFV